MADESVSKAQMVAWFARRPSMYREFGRMTRYRIERQLKMHPDRAADERKATAICAASCITAEEAYPRLGLVSGPPLAERHPADWHAAAERASASPVELGGAAFVELLYDIVREVRPARVVETGVAYGWSSLAILLALDSLGGGALTSIDMPYPALHTESYVGVAVPERLRTRWTLIRRPDRDVLRRVLRDQAPIDLAHYDSDKSRPGRNYAYPLLWESLRPGGILISDDISDNSVFDEFARGTGLVPMIIRKDADHYVGILTKP